MEVVDESRGRAVSNVDANGHQSPRASQRSQLRLEALPVRKVEASRGLQVHSPHSAHTSTSQGTGSATNVAIGIILTVSSATSGIAHEPTGSVGTGSAMCAATTTMPLGHSAQSVLARLQSLRGQLLESKCLSVWEKKMCATWFWLLLVHGSCDWYCYCYYSCC